MSELLDVTCQTTGSCIRPETKPLTRVVLIYKINNKNALKKVFKVELVAWRLDKKLEGH